MDQDVVLLRRVQWSLLSPWLGPTSYYRSTLSMTASQSILKVYCHQVEWRIHGLPDVGGLQLSWSLTIDCVDWPVRKSWKSSNLWSTTFPPCLAKVVVVQPCALFPVFLLCQVSLEHRLGLFILLCRLRGFERFVLAFMSLKTNNF